MLITKKRRFTLAIALLALGVLLSVQYQTQQAVLKDLSAQTKEDLVKVLSSLSDKKTSLTKDLWDLRLQKDSLENNANQGHELTAAMKKELSLLQMFYGAQAIKGPGIVITIPEQTNNITSQELISIINELWNIGAEGIAVNGVRISAYTPVSEDPQTLETLVDGNKISLPYEISAVGDPEKLSTTMAFAGGTIEQLRSYDMIIDIVKREELVLPLARQKDDFKYAKVVDETSTKPKP